MRADLFIGDDAPYVFGNLRLHNRGPRRVNDITVALELDMAHVAAYRCLPPSSPTFAVAAEVAKGKITLRVPYLNVGGDATLSFVARGWAMSPTVRVDAVDVKVVKMISPGALDLSRLRLLKPSKLQGDYFEQFTGKDN